MIAGGQAGRRVPAAQAGKVLEAVIPNPKLKLLDQVREVMRLRHYSIRTEHCYCDWIRRYIKFHRMRCREDLIGGTEKVELFLSDLAVNGQVAASTQNQALKVPSCGAGMGMAICISGARFILRSALRANPSAPLGRSDNP
jgi:hypothetical protein